MAKWVGVALVNNWKVFYFIWTISEIIVARYLLLISKILMYYYSTCNDSYKRIDIYCQSTEVKNKTTGNMFI